MKSKNRVADFSKQVEKKMKKAWNNKWIRYGSYSIVGTVLTLTILYAKLAYGGDLPGFSAIKSSLICSCRKKNLKAAMHTFEKILFEKQVQKTTAQLIAEVLPVEMLPITNEQTIIITIQKVLNEIHEATVESLAMTDKEIIIISIGKVLANTAVRIRHLREIKP